MIKKLAILFLVAVALSGCFPTASKKVQKTGTDEFIKGAVAQGFPNLPLYKGAEVIETYGQDKKYGGAFIAGDSLDKVVNYYAKALPASGWQSSISQKSTTNYVFSINNASLRGEIIVNTAADGKQTAITMSVEPR